MNLKIELCPNHNKYSRCSASPVKGKLIVKKKKNENYQSKKPDKT